MEKFTYRKKWNDILKWIHSICDSDVTRIGGVFFFFTKSHKHLTYELQHIYSAEMSPQFYNNAWDVWRLCKSYHMEMLFPADHEYLYASEINNKISLAVLHLNLSWTSICRFIDWKIFTCSLQHLFNLSMSY